MPHIFQAAIITSVLFLAGCGGSGSGGSSTPTPAPTPPSNSAPVLASANADQTGTTGVAFSYDATQGSTTFTDADNDALTYSVSYDPAASGLSDSAGVISGTPSLAGTITVTVTASDGNGGSASDMFLIVVSDPPAAQKPNILLIISDDQGQDSSAQYSVSSDLPVTPVLEDLAAEGLVFENAWVNPVCTPTRAALLSGRYGVRTGVLEVGDTLPVSETILHEYLATDSATSNYATAMVGKWHLGGARTGPNDAGISHFAGITGGGVSDYYSWPLNINGTVSTSTVYATTELTDQAIDWIGNQSEPWFLWLAYNAPHTPFHLPPNTLHSRNLSGTDADIAANPRPYYLAAIEAMDAEIGRLLGTLSAAERANTVILYIGDNGTPGQVTDNAAFPNGSKGSLFEGGVRVPMVVSGSGVTRRGEREAGLVNAPDFFASISNLAGNAATSVGDSQSFVPVLTASSSAPRDYIYTEIGTANTDGWAVRDARYKLIERFNGTQTLFDLENDPMENDDLLTSGMNVTAILTDLEMAADNIRP